MIGQRYIISTRYGDTGILAEITHFDTSKSVWYDIVDKDQEVSLGRGGYWGIEVTDSFIIHESISTLKEAKEKYPEYFI